MNWKHYKALSPAQKHDETHYIIGLDIGNETSGIAFYNMHERTPEPIDLSGGYGKPSVPTVMQYIAETKEWVFGEYAILNQGVGTEITLQGLIAKLGQNEYLEIDNKTMSIASIVSLFIRELLSSVRNINPRAEIVGIIAVVPDFFTSKAREELKRAIQLAGYEKELIALASNREVMLAHYYRNNPEPNKNVLVLDYGSRVVRGGVYRINSVQGDTVNVAALSNLFNPSIGTEKLGADVERLFAGHYAHATGESAHNQQLAAFTYQHKDMLFQKNIRSKPAKLYYNFVYPPFQQTVTHEDVGELIGVYQQGFNEFISATLEKNTTARPIPPGDISAVLCTGGGFEMLWTREAVQAKFANVHMYKNAKLAIAESAAELAAIMLGVTPGYTISIEDTQQLSKDVGISAGGAFLPLVEYDSYW